MSLKYRISISGPTPGYILPLDSVPGSHRIHVAALLSHLRPDRSDGALRERADHLHLVEVRGENVLKPGCPPIVILHLILRFRSVRTANNYLILSLSFADFLMESKVIIFLINAWHGGPYLGIIGAKVNSPFSSLSRIESKFYFSRSMELFPSYRPSLPSGHCPASPSRGPGSSGRKVGEF